MALQGPTTIVLTLLLIVPLVPTLTADAHHPPYHDHASLGAEIVGWIQAGATVEIPARSDEGRAIYLIKLGNGPQTLLFLNELHANEPSGTEAAVRAIWALLGDQDPSFAQETLPGIDANAPVFQALADATLRVKLLERTTLLFFPMLDPDGVQNGHRRNPLANTDYTTGVTAQSAAIRYAVDTYHPDLILDSHGGPNQPDLNVGVVEPAGMEAATRDASRVLAERVWRGAAAVGADVAGPFQEFPSEFLGLPGDEPIASADQAYWDAATKFVGFTHASYVLQGVPAVFTETVGLQSTAPTISISEGASVQEVTMLALALEAAGLVGGTVPHKLVDTTPAPTTTLTLGQDATELYAVVSWDAPLGEHRIELRDADQNVVASAGPTDAFSQLPQRQARAISVPGPLDGGTYTLVLEPVHPDAPGQLQGTPTLRVVWDEPDATPTRATGILDENVAVDMTAERNSLWATIAPYD